MQISLAERDRRLAALRELMMRKGYAALLLPGQAEATQRGYLRYVSDWRLWGGKGFVLLPQTGDPVLVLGAGSQPNWAKQTAWTEDVRAAWDVLEEVANTLKGWGLAGAQIGLPGTNHVMHYGDMLRLQRLLPAVQWLDATKPVDDLMAVKSDEELLALRDTHDRIVAALEVLRVELAPGRSEREVMALAVQKLNALGCLDGIAHLCTETRPFFHPASERIFQQEDVIKVSLEFAGPTGYWIELAGVYCFQEPPARVRRYFETSLVAMARVQSVLKPGAVGGDVTRTVEATFREAGWNITGRGLWDGHLIGINVIRPPYGLIDDTNVYAANMVMNVHPGILVDGDDFGLFLQDNFVVTPSGGKPVGEYSYEIHLL
jgi:Xaa-Pro aminopeptidase